MTAFDDLIAAPGPYVAKPMPPFVRLWGAGTIWGGVCGVAAAWITAIVMVASNGEDPVDAGQVLLGLFYGAVFFGMYGCILGVVLGTCTGFVAGFVFVALRGRVSVRALTPATVAIVVVIQAAVAARVFWPDLLWTCLVFPAIAIGPMWFSIRKVGRDTRDDTMDA